MRGATQALPPSCSKDCYFNPRAPCGARPMTTSCVFRARTFQSTRPMRGATSAGRRRRPQRRYFNPRAPCGARLSPSLHYAARVGISIHAPHAGRDKQRYWTRSARRHFNPRAPCGARRQLAVPPKLCMLHFNPRAPCGARPLVIFLGHRGQGFQSTRPMRGATAYIILSMSAMMISIHAPHAGRDSKAPQDAEQIKISIHAPHAGRDCPKDTHGPHMADFNPRAPCGARRGAGSIRLGGGYFNPRAPCGARPPTPRQTCTTS